MQAIYTSTLFLIMFLFGCAEEANQNDTAFMQDTAGYGFEASEKTITSTQVETLIAAGRAQLGTANSNCKTWASGITLSALSITLPSTDSSPSTDQYKWTSDTTPATNMARWLGSYANGRVTISSSLAARATSSSTTITVPNSDPQVMVIYTSRSADSSVTATITKGSSSYSVTSTGTISGTISSQFTGSGNWSLSVRNGGGSATSGNIVVAVISYSRFQSDWQTARRGDIMQMYGDFGTNKCDGAGLTPHTTFVQVDRNSTSGSCSGTTESSSNTGCNWLDANWRQVSGVGYVYAHDMEMESMIKGMACSSSYGFTVYRLN